MRQTGENLTSFGQPDVKVATQIATQAVDRVLNAGMGIAQRRNFQNFQDPVSNLVGGNTNTAEYIEQFRRMAEAQRVLTPQAYNPLDAATGQQRRNALKEAGRTNPQLFDLYKRQELEIQRQGNTPGMSINPVLLRSRDANLQQLQQNPNYQRSLENQIKTERAGGLPTAKVDTQPNLGGSDRLQAALETLNANLVAKNEADATMQQQQQQQEQQAAATNNVTANTNIQLAVSLDQALSELTPQLVAGVKNALIKDLETKMPEVATALKAVPPQIQQPNQGLV